MKGYFDKIAAVVKERKLLPKLGSIFLAVVLWAYISNSKSGELRFRIPLNFVELGDDLVVSRTSHKFIVVEVKGNRDDLKNITSRNIKLVVDLSKGVPGEYRTYPIQYQKIDFTDDFKIDLYPEEVKVFIEKRVVKDLRVISRFSGRPERGYMVGKVKLNPEYIRVSGPGSILNKIGAVYTEDIDLEKRSTSFSNDVKIARIEGEGVEMSLTTVGISVPVVNLSDSVVLGVPVVIRNRTKGYRYTSLSEVVKINVISTEKKKYTERMFSAYIDANELKIDFNDLKNENKIEVAGSVHVIGETLDADNSILSVTPETVQVVVTKE